MVLFTHDVKICQIDQRCRCQNGLKNVRCEQGITTRKRYKRNCYKWVLIVTELLTLL